ncbi:flavin-containing monooxygenase [Nonomuraea typhae]|uniref:flavin-containing monooxygenase n=1 Tax=Nonomuraea typhae TaxID=2603600 RepID=UPI001C686E35|nr:NAD(P)-binding domain-containing protein [Nonomuraea typhae]
MIIVIGAGQAGLAAGRELRLAGHEVLLLEARSRLGETWRHRWDSLRLFTPARFSALPGLPFPAAPGHYPDKDEVAAYLEVYAAHFGLPIRLGSPVTRLRRTADGLFEVQVGRVDDRFTASGVLVATGPFQRPHVPDLALPETITGLHSSAYRGPAQLPDGPVLVAGAGNSGVQIAAELAATRTVTLAAGGRQAVAPQRVMGADIFTWLSLSGLVRAPVSGAVGRWMRKRDPLIGMGPRHLRRRGVRVTGRVVSVDGRFVRTADGQRLAPAVVIWATGYRSDYSWLQVAGALSDGLPVHEEGVSPIPGLVYAGLPFQRSRGSALLGWVGEDVARVVGRLVDRPGGRS